MQTNLVEKLKETLDQIYREGTPLEHEETRYLLDRYQEMLEPQGRAPAFTLITVRRGL